MKEFYLVTFHCSGLSAWMRNCFTDLGIRSTYDNLDFKFEGKRDELFDEYSMLDNQIVDSTKVFCPSMLKSRFFFRNDILVNDVVHKIPPANYPKFPYIVGIRDPRDTMLSLFRWWQKGESFLEFCTQHMPDWVKFYESCLQYDKIGIFKFEDRKKDEALFLKKITKFIDMEFADTEISYAVENSSLEKAKVIQQEMIDGNNSLYTKNFSASFKVVDSGVLEKYKLIENQKHKKVFDYIIRHAAQTMKKYGYNNSQIYGDNISDMLKVREIFSNLIIYK